MQNLEIFKAVQRASRAIVNLSENKINEILVQVALLAANEYEQIIEANDLDLKKMDNGDPKYDRLLLTKERLHSISQEIRKLADLPYPIGKIIEKKTLTNGLELEKVTVSLGVVGIIYEARPNVTFDCFGIALKSGNAIILKGGSDAENSNQVIVKLIQEVLVKNGVDKNIVALLPANRESTAELLGAVGFVDVLIPRGSQALIDYVRENAKIPVIETGAGIVHVYFDQFGDLSKGRNIIYNSKTRRVSVCNALDCVLIHKSRLFDLKELVSNLANKNVTIFADELCYTSLKGTYPVDLLKQADEKSFGTEFLDYKMALKVVHSIEEALEHIAFFSSKHSEAIVSESLENIDLFFKNVDAAAVYANASTAFTDGAQFGLGAEIGISTQKLHARGPMAIQELTSYKWLIKGVGQTRE